MSPTQAPDWFPKAELVQATDWRHIWWLYQIALCPSVRAVLEVGSFAGHSTSAFIHLLYEKQLDHLFCIDKTPQGSLKVRIDGAKMDGHKAALAECDSLEILGAFNFPASFGTLAYLDGDHTNPHVWKEFEHVRRFASVVALHDTAYYHQHRKSDGPVMCKQKIMALQGWTCFEDALYRKGERTERGMFVAVRSDQLELVQRSRAAYLEMMSA